MSYFGFNDDNYKLESADMKLKLMKKNLLKLNKKFFNRVVCCQVALLF